MRTSVGSDRFTRLVVIAVSVGAIIAIAGKASAADTLDMSLSPATATTHTSLHEPISLALRDVALSEVMAMLSRQQRVNILLSEGVTGQVSVNLFDVSVDQAVSSIAQAAGFAVEYRQQTYFVVNREDAGKYSPNGLTQLASFDISYASLGGLEETLRPYLSSYGKLNLLPDRRLLVVEDTPPFVERIRQMLVNLDRAPRQILIEARILEVTLDENQNYGLDWRNLFDSDDGGGSFGLTGLATPESSSRAGFVFDLSTPDVEVLLDTLKEQGRVRTLSTPTLLALENQEASVIVGDRRGFQVTTTINQVTTESIEFLESGVILRVTPSIDANGAIMMSVHPEVSTGSVDANGIPSQVTTEVNTQLLVPDGQTVFIGGLIKNTITETRRAVPVLGDVPGLRRLFSSERQESANTETIVLISPRLVSGYGERWNREVEQQVDEFERQVMRREMVLERALEKVFVPLGEQAGEPALDLRLSPSLTQLDPAQ